MFQTILQYGSNMADIAIEEFALAKEYLEKKFEEHPDKILVNQKLSALQPRTGIDISLYFLKSCAVSKKANTAIVPGINAIVDDEVHDVRVPSIHPVAMQR